jgi:hypothetical protein
MTYTIGMKAGAYGCGVEELVDLSVPIASGMPVYHGYLDDPAI